MASFNASVSEETKSKVAQDDANRTRNQTGQCAPMQSPVLGTLKLVAGNGTSVGTVMTLQCPYKHRVVGGGRLSCVQDSNTALWSGGVPECRPVSRYEDEGFRLALLASIISSAIIIFMSIIFITSCLVKRVRKEERRRMERERRKREDAAYWQHMEQQEMTEDFYSQKGRNNNNNNSKQPQCTPQPIHQAVADIQPRTFSDQKAACRYHQQDYHLSIHSSQPHLKAMPPASYINTQTTCVLQPLKTHIPPPLPCSGYDPTLEQPPWRQSMPTLMVSQDSAVSSADGQSLEDPFWKGQHPLDAKSPPIWVISV
ncbi:uncharacterized protein LOC108442355 [Pygocentrus nattereri]|uniref:Sushi domain-containing protein n=1 Tax=Pygocentrus nattereri TaxID=42514 RepID=A0A3B4E4H2_PYGNA|nr:uncharacterized protein LOC108442355 [Pygocentrus nattereri]